jgi:hypothetical protein
MGIIFEIFLLNEPQNIGRSLSDLLAQETISSFYCPCGSTVSEETHLMIHMRLKHKESQKMYLAIKKSLTPEYVMSEEHFEEKYNNFAKKFEDLQELEAG